MKQKLFKSWLLMMCLLFGVGTSWAETKTIEINTTNSGVTGSYADKTFTVGDVTFGFTQWMKSNNIQAKKSTTNSCYNVDAIPGTIKKITVEQTGTYRAITMYGGTSSKPTAQITSPATGEYMEFDFSGKNCTYFSMTTPANAVYINKITVEYDTSGGDTPTPVTYSVTLGDDSSVLTQETQGGKVTLPSRTGNDTYTFVGWSATNITSETTTAPTIISAGDYTPSANITLYPVYRRTEGTSNTVTQDYETAVAPTGWNSNSITRTNGNGISPHGGSYWGSISANGTAYVQYNTALTGNVSVTAYVARTTNNTNKGEFKIQSKPSSSSSWTDKAKLDVYNTTVDEWQELSWTGKLNGEQVRVLYTGGTTAIRAIDDVTITYTTGSNYYISSLPTAKTLKSIAVSGTPTKTTYVAGENFDPAGLTVTGTYDDDSQEAITSGITWSTPDALSACQTSVDITATVNGITSASYTVTGLTVTAPVTLSSIAVKTAPTKTTYTEGEKFDPTGLVITKTMSDNTTEDVAYADDESSFSFEPSLETALVTTDTKVTITYGEKTCEQAITVNAIPTYTVSWSVNGSVVRTDNVKEGSSVTAPLVQAIKDYTFDGWTSTDIKAEVENKPEYVTMSAQDYSPTGNITLYAVYKRISSEGSSEKDIVLSFDNPDMPLKYEDTSITIDGVKLYLSNVGRFEDYQTKELYEYFQLKKEAGRIYTKDDFSGSVNSITVNFDDTNETSAVLNVVYGGNSVELSNNNNSCKLNGATEFEINASSAQRVVKVNSIVFNCTTAGKAYYTTTVVPEYKEQNVDFVASTGTTVGTDKYYATFSKDNDVFIPGEEITVYTISVSGDQLTFNELTKTDNVEIEGNTYSGYYVPANNGVLMSTAYDGAYATETPWKTVSYYNVENVSIKPLAEGNMLHPASQQMSELPNHKFYKLAYDASNTTENVLGFYYGAANGSAFTPRAGAAYLAVPAEQAAKIAGFRLQNDETTGINAVNNVEMKNNAAYNLNGQRISSTDSFKGIVIVNGKKYLRK